ncbi:hypothetical protein A0H81_08372 [Grifola frondosa]|uniref:Uncharacterized protein n=1 Tax=Grifola frondosa TaxID=5627 RepID=A0A1C7M579_GRIFR|nr:hypothetical protein A0H81_08372 [Grifola frondosa]
MSDHTDKFFSLSGFPHAPTHSAPMEFSRGLSTFSQAPSRCATVTPALRGVSSHPDMISFTDPDSDDISTDYYDPLHHQNPAYMHSQIPYDTLQREYNALKHENQQLIKQYRVCRNELETTRNFCTNLMGMLSSHSSNVNLTAPSGLSTGAPIHSSIASATSDTPLRRDDFPNVRYWDKRTYTIQATATKRIAKLDDKPKQRGQTRAANGENVMFPFLEDEHGNELNGIKISTIRSVARGLWRELDEHGQAPEKWGKATNAVSALFYREMRAKFPEFKLCDDNWKLRELPQRPYEEGKIEDVADDQLSPPSDTDIPDMPFTSNKGKERAAGIRGLRAPKRKFNNPLANLFGNPSSSPPPMSISGFKAPTVTASATSDSRAEKSDAPLRSLP